MSLLSISWSPEPVWFSIGALDFRYYSILFVGGLVIAYTMVAWLTKRDGRPSEFVDLLTIYIIIGLIIGSRLGHCLFYNPAYYLTHIGEMLFPISNTPNGIEIGYHGLSSHGGAIGIITAMYLFSRHQKVSFLWVADRVVFPVPLTAMCIRLGNFMNSEIIGNPTGTNWGVVFERVDNLPRHPSQLYEAAAYFLIFFVLLWYYRKQYPNLINGRMFGLFLTLVFVSRFIIEFGKSAQESFEMHSVFSMGQILSIPFIVLGVWLFFFRREKKLFKK